MRLPHHAAGRRRRDRGGARRRGRVVHRDLDGRVDRPPHRSRALPGQVRTGSTRSPARPGSTSPTSPTTSTSSRRARSPNLTSSIIGNVFGFKALKALRLEDMRIPLALRQDVPGPAARHRHGARVPRQVRPPAARRHRRSPSSACRRRTTAASSTRRCSGGLDFTKDDENINSQPFMRWRDRFLLRDGGGQPRAEAATGEIKGHYMNVTAGTDGGDVRARRVRQGDRQRSSS